MFCLGDGVLFTPLVIIEIIIAQRILEVNIKEENTEISRYSQDADFYKLPAVNLIIRLVSSG